MSKSEEGSLAHVRRVRHEISEEFGHDPHRLVDYYIALQDSHADRLLEAVAPKAEPGIPPQDSSLEPAARH